MSNYGPPNGQYPGQPSDPWQQPDPYGQPAGAQYPTSPYGGSEPWGGQAPAQPPYGQGYQHDPYQQPGYGGQPGYTAPPDPHGGPGQPVWGPPTPAAKTRRPGLIIGVVAALVVLVCGGGVLALYLVGRNANTPTAQQRSQMPVTTATGAASAAPTAGGDTPTSDTLDPVTAIKVGQCVVNNGTNKEADLQIVPCGKNTFKVLARFDNTLDPKKCTNVNGYTHYFTYETTPKTDDFVLCLKQQ